LALVDIVVFLEVVRGVLFVEGRVEGSLGVVSDEVALVLEQVLVVAVGVVNVAHEVEHEGDEVPPGDFVLDRHLEGVLDPLGEEEEVVWVGGGEGQKVGEDRGVVIEGELEGVQVV